MMKRFRYYAIAWAVLLAVYNIIVFVAKPIIVRDQTFWVTYGFIMASFVGQIICSFSAFKAENSKKLFLKIPLITESYTAMVIMAVIGSVCMLISGFPYWIGTIICVVILGFSIIAVIKATAAGEMVYKVEEKVKVKTSFIKSLTSDIDSLMRRAETDDIKAEIKNVYEGVRYSDPVSSKELSGIESEIEARFASLKQAIGDNDTERVRVVSKEIIALIENRNKECKRSKV